jgi:hypothetical protein
MSAPGYNLSQSAFQIEPVVAGLFIAISVFTLIYLRAQRGSPLPPSDVFADETHSSRSCALIFLVPAVAQMSGGITIPIAGVRVALGLAAAFMLICAVFAWDGFHYRFSPAGVDIRTLGFRLRSIPAADIREYAVAPWGILRGYGIRGLGGRRAYVWGNKGVRIWTSEGEVFLGHSEPEKIVRDLNLITRNHEAPVPQGS